MNSLLARAMRLLSQRDFSEAEMRRKLLTAHSSFGLRESESLFQKRMLTALLSTAGSMVGSTILTTA